MSALTIFAENRPDQSDHFTSFTDIKNKLQELGVYFERWNPDRSLPADADQETILSAYRDAIEQLKQRFGFQSADVISLTPDHPDKETLRRKFLAEHTHKDFEVRFFVDGQGLFFLHVGTKVYAILCEQGDLISVPAETPHWFDMGNNPYLKCIRLFTTEEGWVAEFTGSDIAASFPTLDQYLARQV